MANASFLDDFVIETLCLLEMLNWHVELLRGKQIRNLSPLWTTIQDVLALPTENSSLSFHYFQTRPFFFIGKVSPWGSPQERWMVSSGKIPNKRDDDWGYSHGNLHISTSVTRSACYTMILMTWLEMTPVFCAKKTQRRRFSTFAYRCHMVWAQFDVPKLIPHWY